MGIEAFFNQIKKQYNIITSLTYPYKKINAEHIFFDFNSIIHNTSQFILKTDNDNIDNIDMLIINSVLENVLNILKNNYVSNNIKTIYIGIDGVPSKAKMLEQKKRRYMGEYMSLMKKKISKKYEIKNKLNWSKNNISPGTSFMVKMCNALKSDDYQKKIKKIVKNMNKYIVSDIYEKGEGEMKLFDYINKHSYLNNINIYSPDADVILLAMLLKSRKLNLNITILRYNQQDTEKSDNTVYDEIDINQLTKIIYKYINKSKLSFQNIINDIVFIFTVFGDDFLPKIESYNVKNDIELLFDLYIKTLNKTENYLLIKENNIIKLNKKVFKILLKILSKNEDDIIDRNYFMKKYHNYNRLIKSLKNINHNNIIDFINDYNSSRYYDLLKFKNIDKLKIPQTFIDFIKKNITIKVYGSNKEIIEQIINYKNKNNKMPHLKNYIKYNKKLPFIKQIDSIKFIGLLPFAKTINDGYHKKQTKNMSEYEKELYELEKLLGKYYKLRGDDKINYENYYKDFFNNNKKKAVNEYIKGLLWVIEYYYNRETYNNWYYPFHKSPLLKDIYENYDEIEWNVNYGDKENHLTIIEQFVYITPFNKNNDKYYDLLMSKNIIPDVKKFVANNEKIYFDIKDIIKNPSKLDCRNAQYLNKCLMDPLVAVEDINLKKFSNEFRKYVSYETQEKIFNKNKINKKYKKYKKRYLRHGNVYHKFKYKYYKQMMNK